MQNKLNLPAGYAALSDEEMIYIDGGADTSSNASNSGDGLFDAIIGISAVVGGVVLASSYVWGIGQARVWLSQKGNTDGNFFTVLGRACDAIGADMKQSSANFVRDGVSTAMVVALAPLSAILLIVK